MSQYGYALVGLMGLAAVVVALLGLAVFRFASAARTARRHLRARGSESAFLSAALQEAVVKLTAQERAMSRRAAASEQLSSQIVDSITAGLLVVDSTHRVDILNPAGRRLLDVAGEPVGTDVRTLLGPVPPLAQVVAECQATGRPIVRRSLEMPTTVRATHLGVTASPLGAEGEEPRGVICLFSDLTNVFELEEQLRLKEALARLGELTAGIAHEFRNGLATIHGYSRLIDPQSLPSQYKPYVEGIRQETESLGKVVTNFLNFARPEQVSFSSVDLGAVVRRASDDLCLELPALTRVRVGGRFGNVQGDEVLLRQAFANLIRNAVEACQEAGRTPEISIDGVVDDQLEICRVTVDDNGPGVPDDRRERVFQPFFTTRARGTGLGLAIVQKIVVTHNGRVTLGAAPSGGASVVVTLPALTVAVGGRQ